MANTASHNNAILIIMSCSGVYLNRFYCVKVNVTLLSVLKSGKHITCELISLSHDNTNLHGCFLAISLASPSLHTDGLCSAFTSLAQEAHPIPNQ